MNILVVDDDSGIRCALSTLITRAKHQVTTAVDGSDALERIAHAEPPFDLIITDHNMPGMSGSDFVSKLRAICHSARVIVFSANVSPVDERRYYDLKVKKMLSKPSGFKELIDMLNGLADLSAKAQMFWLKSETTG